MDSPARVGRLRNRLAKRLSLGAKITWLASFVAFIALLGGYPEASWLSSALMAVGIATFGGLVSMVLSWVTSLRSADGPGHVTFHDGVLRVKRGRELVALGPNDITSANVQPMAMVEVESRAGDRWILEMASDEDAAKLVADLGFAPGGRPVTYAFATRGRRFLHVPVAFVAYQASVLVGGMLGVLLSMLVPQFPNFMLPMLVLTFLATFMGFKRLISAPIVTVGNDGIWVRTMGFKKRFVPIVDILMAHQAAVGNAIRLKLRDGSVVHLGGVLVDPARRDAAAIHIRALLAKHAELQKSTVPLAREGRTVRDWREHLRRVVEGSGYRVAATSDSLVDLVGAPGITPEERVGAALALRVSGKDAVPRIRIAAEQCVDPKTRIALEAAAQDEIDEVAIEKALR